MSEAVLLTILGGMAGCVGGIFLWIYQHSRHCHAGDASRDARVDAELGRLSNEVGHTSEPGTILERQHRQGKSIREIRTTLGMPPEPGQ